MNSNELNNYINSLNEYGNNELKVKLENFYLFNKPVISFFKGIDSQFQSLMSAKSIDENVVNDIIGSKDILDALTNAKRELFSFNEIILSESAKNKLLKNYDYIINTMVLNEALTMIQKFFTLLSENELALKSEQEELENLKKKKIEDDRKKKEEEKRKEELRLAEIELKKQEEKQKLKELEEKRKQEEIRIKQEKERLEKERIESVKRKELEEKQLEEIKFLKKLIFFRMLFKYLNDNEIIQAKINTSRNTSENSDTDFKIIYPSSKLIPEHDEYSQVYNCVYLINQLIEIKLLPHNDRFLALIIELKQEKITLYAKDSDSSLSFSELRKEIDKILVFNSVPNNISIIEVENEQKYKYYSLILN